MPGGISARMELVADTICAIARSRLTSGWKEIFWIDRPLRVCASMFLIPLTLALIEYWL